MPVESSSRCRPAALERYATWTSRLRWRRHNELKSGTGHSSPDNASSVRTKHVVCRKVNPKRFDGQAVLDGRIGELRAVPAFAAGSCKPAMPLSSQMVGEPRALSAALYCFQLVVR